MNGEREVPPEQQPDQQPEANRQGEPSVQPDTTSQPSDVQAKNEADGEHAETPQEQPDPLQEAIQERDRLKEQLLRTAADFENFRKRSRRDAEEARARGSEDTLREILPVIDNLERAVAAASEAADVESIREGVRMVLRLFEDTAGRLGLERVPAVGARFDPMVHEAIQQVESHEHPPGAIVSEAVPGYRLGDRLLRAALVVVSRGPGAEQPQPRTEADGPT